MENRTKNMILGAAIAGLVSGGALFAPKEALAKSKKTDDVKCFGVNACKGKSACKTASNDCKGQNGCGKKGVMLMSAKKCAKKGGTTEEKPADAPAAKEEPKT